MQYQVDPNEVYKSFYALQDPRGQIEAYVHDSIRGTVPGIMLDDLFVSKAKIAKSIMEELNADMASTGYGIKTVLIVDIDPDAKVKVRSIILLAYLLLTQSLGSRLNAFFASQPPVHFLCALLLSACV